MASRKRKWVQIQTERRAVQGSGYEISEGKNLRLLGRTVRTSRSRLNKSSSSIFGNFSAWAVTTNYSKATRWNWVYLLTTVDRKTYRKKIQNPETVCGEETKKGNREKGGTHSAPMRVSCPKKKTKWYSRGPRVAWFKRDKTLLPGDTEQRTGWPGWASVGFI